MIGKYIVYRKLRDRFAWDVAKVYGETNQKWRIEYYFFKSTRETTIFKDQVCINYTSDSREDADRICAKLDSGLKEVRQKARDMESEMIKRICG